MLTGKKIGVFFISIFFICLAFSSLPKIVSAQDFPSSDPVIDNSGANLLIQAKATYAADRTKNTFDVGTNGDYVVTDGLDYVFFHKGTPDPALGTTVERDASKDTLIGVGTRDGQFTDVSNGATNANSAAQMAAVNAIAQQHGEDTTSIPGLDPWSQVMAKNNSVNNNANAVNILQQIQQDEAVLQAQKDELLAENPNADTTSIDNQLAQKQQEYNTLRQDTGTNVKNAALPPPQQPDQIYCFQWTSPMFNFPGCAAIAGNWMLSVAAFFLWIAALLFDLTLGITLNFGGLLKTLQVVTIGWGIFRDVSNIFFIFLLLTAALGTIVGSSKYSAKSMIPGILIAAVLINFSLFFTEAIIDASNIMSLQFYAHMGGTTTGNPFATEVANGSTQATGIAAVFLDSMNLKSLYTLSTNQASGNGGAAAAAGQSAGVGLSAQNIALVGIGGTILFLVTTFVLLAAIFLFIARTIILILLLATSPIAYMAHAVPGGQLKGLSDKWWKALWNQVFFAPVYMALMYLAVIAVKSLGTAGGTAAGGFASMFNGNGSSINIVFTFIMIIGFMVAALMSAVTFGATGAGMAMSTGKKLRGYGASALRTATIGVAAVGARRVIGGTADQLANSEFGKKYIGNAPMRALLSVSKQKFGTGKTYGEVAKAREERDSSLAKHYETLDANSIKMKSGETFAQHQARVSAAEKAASVRADKSLGITRIKTAKIDKDGNVVKDKDGKPVMEEVGANISSGFFSNATRATRAGHSRAQQARLKKEVDKVKKKNDSDKKHLEKVSKIDGEIARKKENLAEAEKKKEDADAAFASQAAGTPGWEMRKAEFETQIKNVDRISQEITNLEHQKSKADEDNEVMDRLNAMHDDVKKGPAK